MHMRVRAPVKSCSAVILQIQMKTKLVYSLKLLSFTMGTLQVLVIFIFTPHIKGNFPGIKCLTF